MLTNRQQAFCDEYLATLNATQAAINAGYSPNSAASIAAENLRKPEIEEYISQRLAEKTAERVASQDEVLEYLTSVMRGGSQSEIIVIEGEGEGVTRASKISKAPDEKERLKAAELLGKVHGLFREKLDTSVTFPVVISGEENLE